MASLKHSHNPKTLEDTNDYSKVKKDLKVDSRRKTRRRDKQNLPKSGE